MEHFNPRTVDEGYGRLPLSSTLPDPFFFPPGTPGSSGLEQPANVTTDII